MLMVHTMVHTRAQIYILYILVETLKLCIHVAVCVSTDICVRKGCPVNVTCN